MIQRDVLFILFCTLMTPQLLLCWPQRRTTRQHTSQSTAPPISSCNLTFPETRGGRPSYPDPKVEGDDAAKERSDRVIFPGPSKTSPPSRINNSPSKLNFPDSDMNQTRVSQTQNSKLNFPDSIVSRTGVPDTLYSYVPLVPPSARNPSCAAGSTFCKEIDNYPSDYVNQIITNEVQTFKEFFGDDETTQPNITQRIDASDEAPLCPSYEEYVYPKSALSKDDKWLYIINMQDQFLQGVRVERCIKEGACALTETLPIGYKTSCKQKYIYRKLLSLNEDGKALSDSFRFPSCCACYFRMTFVTRIGSGPGDLQSMISQRGTRGGAVRGTAIASSFDSSAERTDNILPTVASERTQQQKAEVDSSPNSTPVSLSRAPKERNDTRKRA